MADQTTTIAALPAGYATLAGVIYAVAATSPGIWSHTAWVKMSRIFPQKKAERDPFLQSKERRSETIDTTTQASICRHLSQAITTGMRQVGTQKSEQNNEDLIQRVAVFHLIYSHLRQHGQDQQRTSDEESPETLATDTQVPPSLQSTSFRSDLGFPSILVKVVDFSGREEEVSAKLTVSSLRDVVTVVVSSAPILTRSVMESIANHAHTRQFVTTVSIQAAAPFDLLIVELAYKAIEIAFGCGVILGSTGGAWLGLTLGSMFPQRIAAGIYASSYGQVLPRQDMLGQHLCKNIWRPAGTIWTVRTDGSTPYCIEPSAVFSDTWRTAVGYWMQYALLVVVQYFKLSLRRALEFGPYSITRDAIRYILLVIELFTIITCGLTLRKQPQKLGSRRWRSVIAGTVYLVMLSSALACVVLGQKSFMKPIRKFYLVSKIVDPIAAVGSVAVMNVDWQENESLLPETWALLWAMGACTVVW